MVNDENFYEHEEGRESFSSKDAMWLACLRDSRPLAYGIVFEGRKSTLSQRWEC